MVLPGAYLRGGGAKGARAPPNNLKRGKDEREGKKGGKGKKMKEKGEKMKSPFHI